HALTQEQGGMRMTEIVKPDPREPGSVEERVKRPADDVGLAQRPAVRIAEHESIPVRRITLAHHGQPMIAQRRNHDCRQVDPAPGPGRLRFHQHQLPRAFLELIADMETGGPQIEIRPDKAEELSLTHPGAEGGDVESMKPVQACRFEKSIDLLWG